MTEVDERYVWDVHFDRLLHRTHVNLIQAWERRKREGLTTNVLSKKMNIEEKELNYLLMGGSTFDLKTLSDMARAMDYRLEIEWRAREDLDVADQSQPEQ